MSPLTVLMFCLLIRLSSVFLVCTWYVPDEYWQSLEVAHNFVYGYGYLTWEWKTGIRSYLYPALISVMYKILNLLRLDYPLMLIYIPRVFQAVLSAYSDVCFWRWSGKTKWSLYCMVTAWFWYYMGSRTLINTMETSLTTIALSKFPLKKTYDYDGESSSPNVIWLIGFLFALRPTSALIWAPLCCYHLMTLKRHKMISTLIKYATVGLTVLVLTCLVDSIAHGSFVLTWWEFLKVNVVTGVGSWYGTQPWHWYLSQGLPVILGIQLLPFMLASVEVLVNRKMCMNEFVLLATTAFTIAVYSLLSHKEFRFILPVLPLVLYLNAQYLSQWSRKADELLVWLVAGSILLASVLPAAYLSFFHQRGPLDVMSPLRDIAAKDPKHTDLLFLMPCHSTPMYSHLHYNVTTRFLTCNPNLYEVENYMDEADHFYQAPRAWLRNHYPPSHKLPSHIITYDCLVPLLSDILTRYRPVNRVYHSTYNSGDPRVGKYIVIHERIDF